MAFNCAVLFLMFYMNKTRFFKFYNLQELIDMLKYLEYELISTREQFEISKEQIKNLLKKKEINLEIGYLILKQINQEIL